MDTGINKVVALAGSQGKLAKRLGVSQAAISKWVTRGYPPTGRIIEIESEYGVPRLELLDPRLGLGE